MTEEQIEVKIGVLMDTMTHLANVLVQENNALKEHKVEVVTALQEQKQTFGNNYYGQMQYVAANPKMFLALDAKGREELRKTARALDEAMRENERLLKLGIEVNEKIMETIIDAAKKHDQRNSVYAANGALGLGAQMAPISCDQVF